MKKRWETKAKTCSENETDIGSKRHFLRRKEQREIVNSNIDQHYHGSKVAKNPGNTMTSKKILMMSLSTNNEDSGNDKMNSLSLSSSNRSATSVHSKKPVSKYRKNYPKIRKGEKMAKMDWKKCKQQRHQYNETQQFRRHSADESVSYRNNESTIVLDPKDSLLYHHRRSRSQNSNLSYSPQKFHAENSKHSSSWAGNLSPMRCNHDEEDTLQVFRRLKAEKLALEKQQNQLTAREIMLKEEGQRRRGRELLSLLAFDSPLVDNENNSSADCYTDDSIKEKEKVMTKLSQLLKSGKDDITRGADNKTDSPPHLSDRLCLKSTNSAHTMNQVVSSLQSRPDSLNDRVVGSNINAISLAPTSKSDISTLSTGGGGGYTSESTYSGKKGHRRHVNVSTDSIIQAVILEEASASMKLSPSQPKRQNSCPPSVVLRDTSHSSQKTANSQSQIIDVFTPARNRARTSSYSCLSSHSQASSLSRSSSESSMDTLLTSDSESLKLRRNLHDTISDNFEHLSGIDDHHSTISHEQPQVIVRRTVSEDEWNKMHVKHKQLRLVALSEDESFCQTKSTTLTNSLDGNDNYQPEKKEACNIMGHKTFNDSSDHCKCVEELNPTPRTKNCSNEPQYNNFARENAKSTCNELILETPPRPPLLSPPEINYTASSCKVGDVLTSFEQKRPRGSSMLSDQSSYVSSSSSEASLPVDRSDDDDSALKDIDFSLSDASAVTSSFNKHGKMAQNNSENDKSTTANNVKENSVPRHIYEPEKKNSSPICNTLTLAANTDNNDDIKDSNESSCSNSNNGKSLVLQHARSSSTGSSLFPTFNDLMGTPTNSSSNTNQMSYSLSQHTSPELDGQNSDIISPMLQRWKQSCQYSVHDRTNAHNDDAEELQQQNSINSKLKNNLLSKRCHRRHKSDNFLKDLKRPQDRNIKNTNNSSQSPTAHEAMKTHKRRSSDTSLFVSKCYTGARRQINFDNVLCEESLLGSNIKKDTCLMTMRRNIKSERLVDIRPTNDANFFPTGKCDGCISHYDQVDNSDIRNLNDKSSPTSGKYGNGSKKQENKPSVSRISSSPPGIIAGNTEYNSDIPQDRGTIFSPLPRGKDAKFVVQNLSPTSSVVIKYASTSGSLFIDDKEKESEVSFSPTSIADVHSFSKKMNYNLIRNNCKRGKSTKGEFERLKIIASQPSTENVHDFELNKQSYHMIDVTQNVVHYYGLAQRWKALTHGLLIGIITTYIFIGISVPTGSIHDISSLETSTFGSGKCSDGNVESTGSFLSHTSSIIVPFFVYVMTHRASWTVCFMYFVEIITQMLLLPLSDKNMILNTPCNTMKDACLGFTGLAWALHLVHVWDLPPLSSIAQKTMRNATFQKADKFAMLYGSFVSIFAKADTSVYIPNSAKTSLVTSMIIGLILGYGYLGEFDDTSKNDTSMTMTRFHSLASICILLGLVSNHLNPDDSDCGTNCFFFTLLEILCGTILMTCSVIIVPYFESVDLSTKIGSNASVFRKNRTRLLILLYFLCCWDGFVALSQLILHKDSSIKIAMKKQLIKSAQWLIDAVEETR